MYGPPKLRLHRALAIYRLTKDIEDTSKRTSANWHGDWTGQQLCHLTAPESFRALHSYGSEGPVAQQVLDFHCYLARDDGLCHLHVWGVDGRATDIHDRADDLCYLYICGVLVLASR